MKHLLLVACMAIASFAVHAHQRSNEKKISYQARQTFQHEFGNQQNVVWKNLANDMAKAVFQKDGKEITVFLSNDGEIIATSETVVISQLPSKVKAAIQKISENQPISDLFYLEQDNVSGYYFSLEKSGSKKVYCALKNGHIRDITKLVL